MRALRLRPDKYAENRTPVTYGRTSAALAGGKKEPECEWLDEASSVPFQQRLRRLHPSKSEPNCSAVISAALRHPGIPTLQDRADLKSDSPWEGEEPCRYRRSFDPRHIRLEVVVGCRRLSAGMDQGANQGCQGVTIPGRPINT